VTERLHRRLSAHDAMFLYWENPLQPMHVAECFVYAGTFTAAHLRAAVAARMPLLPRYRQRVVVPPLHAGFPTWEDDPHFDLSAHVDEHKLPAPGDDDALSRVGGELFGELLDRRRPLWKATVLQGHHSSGTVVFLKLHHAMVDGVSSIDLVEALHAPAPTVRSLTRPATTPGALQQALAAVADQAGGVLRDLAGLVRRPPAPARLLTTTRVAAECASLALRPAPATPFNRPISRARRFAWLEVPLDAARGTAQSHDATLNDLVLAVLAGAVGRYMRRHGYPTDDVVLRTLCPVSVRTAEEAGNLGNRVSMVVAPLHVGERDGARRVRLQREAMRERKRRGEASGWLDLIKLMQLAPAPVMSQVHRLYPRSTFPLNISSTNVRGPAEPLVLEGHELLHWYPIGVQWTDQGLFLCTLSYRGRLTFGLVADPGIVPDLDEVVEDMRWSYDEIAVAHRPSSRRISRAT
jgi:diacylglycerol O-acyltransferase